MAGEISLQSVLNRTAFQAMSSPQKIYSLIHLRSTGQGSHMSFTHALK